MVRRKTPSERGQLDLFHARPGGVTTPRDAQDLMAYPFFALGKSKRLVPIEYHARGVEIRVEAVPEYGMATIWDADILIWAASQIVEARDAGLRTSRLMATTPYDILRFTRRGTSMRDYQRLKAALDRLQSTTICTSLRQPIEGRRHRFSWINEWVETTDDRGRPLGIELILPDWFYSAVMEDALILSFDPAYFDLTGGLERWLYRLVRKHGGKQRQGWQFEFRHLHRKSGSHAAYKRFAFDLREIIRKQPLPGYRLGMERSANGEPLLTFSLWISCGKPMDGVVLSGTRGHVLSGTHGSCYQEPKQGLSRGNQIANPALNLESNKESNFGSDFRSVDKARSKPRNPQQSTSENCHETGQAAGASPSHARRVQP